MSDLTEVEVLWLEKRIENRIRFGRVVKEKNLDRWRRVLSFAPGSIFAFVRVDLERLWRDHFADRYLARSRTGTALLDCAVCEAWRRDFVAALRLAEG